MLKGLGRCDKIPMLCNGILYKLAKKSELVDGDAQRQNAVGNPAHSMKSIMFMTKTMCNVHTFYRLYFL